MAAQLWVRALDVIRKPGTQYFVAGLGEKAVRALLLLWAARIVGPVGMSGWNLYSLLLTFGAIPQLAQVNGLRRELPLLLGRPGGDGAADEHAWSAAIGGTLVPILLVLSLTISRLPGIALATTVALVGQTLLQVSNAGHVGRMSLHRAAIQQAVSAIAMIGGASLLIPRLGVVGYGVTLGFAGLVATVAVPSWRGSLPRLGVAWRRAAYLAAAGFWPMLAGLVFWLPTAFDRSLIAIRLGTGALGLYTLALQLGTAMMWVRAGVSEQWYPRIARAVAERQGRAEISRLAVRQLRLSLLVCGAALAGAIVLGWPGVAVFLRNYETGLGAALAMGLASIAGVPNQVAGNVLHALRLSREYLLWQSGGALAILLAMWLAVTLHPALWVVPAAAGTVSLAFGLLLYQLGMRRLASRFPAP
jgi:O-antigen/teichoic acid export membrane protein